MGNDFQQIGKFLILAGIGLAAIGVVIVFASKLGGFRLPGDISLEGKNWKVFLPIGTCIIISVVLTLVMWLINFFTRK